MIPCVLCGTLNDFVRWKADLRDALGEEWHVSQGYVASREKVVRRHFETDYSESFGVRDLGSNVSKVAVSAFTLLDSLENYSRLDGFLNITCNVILENGESLSREEALEGLGEFAPRFVEERIRKVQNEWLPTDRRRHRLNHLSALEGGVQQGEA